MGTATELFDAVRAGDLDGVEALLRDDVSLATATNEGGVSALLWALYTGQPRIAERLVASGIELSIFEAAAAGDPERVRALIASDPTLVNAGSADGFSPLGLAAFFGRLEVLEILLAHGADPNAASRNQMQVTPLHSAAAHRQPEVSLALVEALLRAGAKANVRQHGGWTPLHQSAAHGRAEAVELLLRHGADVGAVSDDGQTPADKAADAGYSAIAERLREG